nr:unnamed protein product [Digitaria exilis]
MHHGRRSACASLRRSSRASPQSSSRPCLAAWLLPACRRQRSRRPPPPPDFRAAVPRVALARLLRIKSLLKCPRKRIQSAKKLIIMRMVKGQDIQGQTFLSELISLRIPFWLEQLSFLHVSACYMLQVIEINAPNVHTLKFYGDPVHLKLGASAKVKNLEFNLSKNSSVSYAITKLPSTVPTLESLGVSSYSEINTPMVNQKDVKHGSVFGNASHMRQILGHKHDRLRKVLYPKEK